MDKKFFDNQNMDEFIVQCLFIVNLEGGNLLKLFSNQNFVLYSFEHTVNTDSLVIWTSLVVWALYLVY